MKRILAEGAAARKRVLKTPLLVSHVMNSGNIVDKHKIITKNEREINVDLTLTNCAVYGL